MGLARVKEEILRKAKSEATSVVKEGKAELEKSVKEAQERIEEKRKEAETELRDFLENMEKKELSATEFELRKELFQKKRELMNSVFERAEARLIKSSPAKKELFLKKLLNEARKEINVKRVYSTMENKKFILGLEFHETEMKGGLIAETADKSVRVDYSFETLLQDVQEKNLPSIANILFGK